MVKPKKHLGQHFLADQNIANKIVDSLSLDQSQIIEIGPGTGVLTKLLLERKDVDFRVIEIDRESVAFLHEEFPALNVIEGDFLKFNLGECFDGNFAIIGNFPYNISSQIFFKVVDHRNQVNEVVGMIQKEVAERIAAGPGSKTYGILSVILQAFYNIKYLFTVSEGVFIPPPKVKSAVIRLSRNERESLDCDEKLFMRIVKQGFNQRRKTLRNSLKSILVNLEVDPDMLAKRPEQLSVEEFVLLTQQVETGLNKAKD